MGVGFGGHFCYLGYACKAPRDRYFKNLVFLIFQDEPMLHSAAGGTVGCVQR